MLYACGEMLSIFADVILVIFAPLDSVSYSRWTLVERNCNK